MWEDQTVWPVTSVTQAVQEFRFIVTLNSDGSYTERTQETSTAMTVGRAPGGGVGLGFSKSGFSGNSSRKEFSWTPGQKGMQTEIDSTMLKQPLRDYLANQGWKKKGGLSKLFG
jgi:hypothetical protein